MTPNLTRSTVGLPLIGLCIVFVASCQTTSSPPPTPTVPPPPETSQTQRQSPTQGAPSSQEQASSAGEASPGPQEQAGSEAATPASSPSEAQSERETTADQADSKAASGGGGSAPQWPQTGEPSAGEPSDASTPIPATHPAVLTDQETEALLERQLEASLIEFDGQLLREQEALQAAEAARAGAEAASDGGASGSEATHDQGMDAGASGAGSETSAHTSSGGGSLPDAQPTRQGGTSQGQQQQGPRMRRTDIPDGADDDIVARQLREAAERETDPALKEKLWDEYRKYKQGSRG